MNYRSKRTSSSYSEEAQLPQKKLPISTSAGLNHAAKSQSAASPLGGLTAASQLAMLQSSSVPSSDFSHATSTSSNLSTKWGPFGPPVLGRSKLFGSLSQPMKTVSTPSPSTVALQSAMLQSGSVPSNFHLKTSTSKPLLTPSHSFPPVGASQSAVPKSSSMPSKFQLKTSTSNPTPPQPPRAESQNRSSSLFRSSAQQTKIPHTQTQNSEKATEVRSSLSFQSSAQQTKLPHTQTQNSKKATEAHTKSSSLFPTSAQQTELSHTQTQNSKKATGAHTRSSSLFPSSTQQIELPHPQTQYSKTATLQLSKSTHHTSMSPSTRAKPPSQDTCTGSDAPLGATQPPEVGANATASKIIPQGNTRHYSEKESDSEYDDLSEPDVVETVAPKSKPRCRIIVKDWPSHVKFDESEEVVAFDAEGERRLVKGSVQPRDVWTDAPWFKYLVQFNDFYQPLQKGGSILVSFIGDIAKTEEFCPVGVESWRKVNRLLKERIVDTVREHFLIPEGKLMNNALLRRTSRAWKHYRYTLKRDYFDPMKKTIEQNYASIPVGVSPSNWGDLVNYWLTPNAKKYSELGKAARESKGLAHRSGATSFANRRHDLKKKKGGDVSELDFFISVHGDKDGNLKQGTQSHQFVEDANRKVQECIASSSSAKSKVDVENDVFNDLMYQGRTPKHPLNYGFGVNQSDIFGVERLLRKKGSTYVNNAAQEVGNLKAELLAVKKQNKDLALQHQVLSSKFDETSQSCKMLENLLTQVLKEVRNGNASSAFVGNAMQQIHSQVVDGSCSNGNK